MGRIGKLSLFRPEKRGFSQREERLLASASSYLDHLWDAPLAVPDCANAESVDDAWLLADRQGHIHFLSDPCYSWARPLLTRLAGCLEAAEAGRASPPPVMELRNRVGIFKLRAWRMSAITGGSACMGVRIDHSLPLSIRLLSSPVALGLSTRERDVMLALASGLNRMETASRLGVGLSSVVTYTRSLYNRLGVNNRDQMVTAILAGNVRPARGVFSPD